MSFKNYHKKAILMVTNHYHNKYISFHHNKIDFILMDLILFVLYLR